MKKPLRISLLFTVLCIFNFEVCIAQDKPLWSAKFSKSINWYWLTPSGIFLVSTNDALYGIDPKKNGIAWELKDYGAMDREKATQYNETPYVAITKYNPGTGGDKLISIPFKTLKPSGSSSFVRGTSLDRMILLDPVNGDIIFDLYSDQFGFDRIEKKYYLPEINCILLEGTKDKTRIFGIYDLNKRQMRFTVEKPVKLKQFTLRDNLDFYVQPNGNILIKYASNTYMMDIATGEKKWMRMNDSLYQFVFDPAGNSIYASGGNFIAKIDAATGNMIAQLTPPDLQQKQSLAEKYYSNLFLSGIKLLPMQDKLMGTYNGGVNFFDYNTLQPKWNNSLQFPGLSVINIKPGQNNNMLLFLKNISSEQTFLMYADTTGKPLWDNPFAIDGSFIKMLETGDKGILCVTNQQADVISWETGKSKLEKTLKFKPDEYVLIAHAKAQNSIGFYNNGKVYEINYATNAVRTLVDKTNFKGPDDEDKRPTTLEAMPDGYFLSAPQNLMLIGYDGNIKYNSYYKKPGLSDKAKRMLAFGGGVALGLVFSEEAQKLTNEMYHNGLMSTDNFITIKAFDTQAGAGSALITGGLSNMVFAQLNERRKIVQGKGLYQLVLSKLDNGNIGFLKIDKNSGQTSSSIDFDDKNPEIKIDDAIAGLYYIDDKEVFFYSMK